MRGVMNKMALTLWVVISHALLASNLSGCPSPRSTSGVSSPVLEGSADSEEGEGVGGVIEGDIRTLRERYRYGKCDKRWLQVVQGTWEDANTATELISRDQCVNLIDGIVLVTRHRDFMVRRRGAELLGRIPAAGNAKYLSTLLDDKHSAVAGEALKGLCRISSKECKLHLEAILAGGKASEIRGTAIRIAVSSGIGVRSEVWESVLRSASSETAKAAFTLIPCDQLAAPGLTKTALETINENERRSALAIGTFERCHVQAACPTLLAALGDERRVKQLDGETQKALLHATARCDGSEGRHAMERFIRSAVTPGRMAHYSISNEIVPRESALEMLTGNPTANTVEVLRLAMRDPFYRVRLAALRAIDRAGLVCEVWTDLESAELHDSSEVVRAETRTRLEKSRSRCVR